MHSKGFFKVNSLIALVVLGFALAPIKFSLYTVPAPGHLLIFSFVFLVF